MGLQDFLIILFGFGITFTTIGLVVLSLANGTIIINKVTTDKKDVKKDECNK